MITTQDSVQDSVIDLTGRRYIPRQRSGVVLVQDTWTNETPYMLTGDGRYRYAKETLTRIEAENKESLPGLVQQFLRAVPRLTVGNTRLHPDGVIANIPEHRMVLERKLNALPGVRYRIESRPPMVVFMSLPVRILDDPFRCGECAGLVFRSDLSHNQFDMHLCPRCDTEPLD